MAAAAFVTGESVLSSAGGGVDAGAGGGTTAVAVAVAGVGVGARGFDLEDGTTGSSSRNSSPVASQRAFSFS